MDDGWLDGVWISWVSSKKYVLKHGVGLAGLAHTWPTIALARGRRSHFRPRTTPPATSVSFAVAGNSDGGKAVCWRRSRLFDVHVMKGMCVVSWTSPATPKKSATSVRLLVAANSEDPSCQSRFTCLSYFWLPTTRRGCRYVAVAAARQGRWAGGRTMLPCVTVSKRLQAASSPSTGTSIGCCQLVCEQGNQAIEYVFIRVYIYICIYLYIQNTCEHLSLRLERH